MLVILFQFAFILFQVIHMFFLYGFSFSYTSYTSKGGQDGS